jgi:hypothetical protein
VCWMSSVGERDRERESKEREGERGGGGSEVRDGWEREKEIKKQ